MTSVPARRLVWSIAAVSIATMALGVILSLTYIAQTGDARALLSHQVLLPLSTLIYAILGVAVTSRHPRNVIGWVLAVTGLLFALTALAAGSSAYETLDSSSRSEWSTWLEWLNGWVWIPATILPIVFVFLYFPDGHLISRRWIPVAWSAALGLVLQCVGFALYPALLSEYAPQGANPLTIDGARPLLDLLANAGGTLLILGAVGSLVALIVRFRRSRGTEREQMKWLVYAATFVLVGSLLGWVAASLTLSDAAATEVGIVMNSLGLLAIAVSVSIAILRYRLYDIDFVINRTLVYATLTAAVAGLYAVVVGGLGVLLQARGSLALSLLSIAAVAMLAQPVRDRLQRGVNRLMYGERDDPYAVLSRLAQRLEATLAPEAVLPSIVETVAQALKLPYAAIGLATAPGAADPAEGFPLIAEYGLPVANSVRLPLTYQSEPVGVLIVGSRSGESFSAADRRLLGDVARQAGVAAHAVRLTAGLQRSREQLVTAREEERRRLRRDLHDGLGSQLAALHLRAGTLRRSLPPGLPEADAAVAEFQGEIHAAISEIRRLVYELRPPALDELGLAGALRSLAAQCSSANGLQVRVEAPEQLPPLPAAVEVAGYRIAQEALANVVHHAGASICEMHLSLGDDLRLEIHDDGRGMVYTHHTGVGLHSMRERAAELGGTCAVEGVPGGGVQVHVRLPLHVVKD